MVKNYQANEKVLMYIELRPGHTYALTFFSPLDPFDYTGYYQIRHEMQKWQRGEDKRLDNSEVNLVYRGVVDGGGAVCSKERKMVR